MDCEFIKQCLGQASWSAIAVFVAVLTAIVAAVSAFLSYRLSEKIYDEIKSDETIIVGPLHHPGLFTKEHNECVLWCTLFNKSKRKTYVSSVEATNKKGSNIKITWSESMDDLGNIQNPTGLIGLNDSINLVLRRNDGDAFGETVVYIKHSFSSNIITAVFVPYADFK